jgi:glycosyltransferase involved in cell wall biosynthesis
MYCLHCGAFGSRVAPNGIAHEIVVVDDGGADSTWQKLQDLAGRLAELNRFEIRGDTVLGRAITYGFDQMNGDAVVIMIADESETTGMWSAIGSYSMKVGMQCLVRGLLKAEA